jgi:TonB family protein
MFASPKRSALLSWLLHCGAILLILATTGVKPQLIRHTLDVLWMPADIDSYKMSAHSGGGGGGVHADSPASRGEVPRFAHKQFSFPTVDIQNATPILPMEPTLIGDPDIKLAAFNYKQWGDPNGVLGTHSGGPGDGGGIGNGHGSGIGPGDGPGLGPGKDGGFGGDGVGYMGVGGGAVTAPTLLSKTEPEYSEEARKARLQGTVLLRIEVDAHGLPQNIAVRQALGLGLDDRAIDAVKKWRFRPGKVNGKPAAVVAFVEVNFRLL